VLPSLAGGGAERAAVQILNGLSEEIWERSMYLFRREGPYLGDLAPSIRLAAGTSGSRVGRWQQLRRFIRSVKPEVVVSFLSYFSVLTAARAAGVGARIVFNQQTPLSAFLADADYRWRRPWGRFLFSAMSRVGYAAADLIVATSQGVANDLAASFGVRPQRVRVVHNPVDLGAIAGAVTEPLDPASAALWRSPVVVAAGRLAEAKNYPLLVEAMAILRERVTARLFILGQGEQEARLRQLIAAHGLEDSVHLVGFKKNPWKYIARADVFALTSRYEGFGNVLVEAMACGVPVVATASPGTREIVTDTVDGVLVEPHTPAAMAAALERVLTEDLLRNRLAAGARDSAKRFALTLVARRYDAVLMEALA